MVGGAVGVGFAMRVGGRVKCVGWATREGKMCVCDGGNEVGWGVGASLDRATCMHRSRCRGGGLSNSCGIIHDLLLCDVEVNVPYKV